MGQVAKFKGWCEKVCWKCLWGGEEFWQTACQMALTT